MNRWIPLLFLLFVLVGAGCGARIDEDRVTDLDALQDLSEQLDADIAQRQADVQVIEVEDEEENEDEEDELEEEMEDAQQDDASTSEVVEDEEDAEETSEPDGPGILEVSMEAGNFFFSPDVITAEPGQEIELTFESNSGTHTFVIDEIGFSTGVSVNETVTFTAPTDPGSYAYYCDVGSHRALGMEGTIIVQ